MRKRLAVLVLVPGLWLVSTAPQAQQRVVAALEADPQMRTDFINEVAAPIFNKMLECGMIS